MLYKRGFRDGAAALAYRHPTEPDYMRGYNDGLATSAGATQCFAAGIGYDMSRDILRDGHAVRVNGCEWNPITNEPATEINAHFISVEATTLIGSSAKKTWHVCASCSRLPVFKHFKKRPLRTTEPAT